MDKDIKDMVGAIKENNYVFANTKLAEIVNKKIDAKVASITKEQQNKEI